LFLCGGKLQTSGVCLCKSFGPIGVGAASSRPYGRLSRLVRRSRCSDMLRRTRVCITFPPTRILAQSAESRHRPLSVNAAKLRVSYSAVVASPFAPVLLADATASRVLHVLAAIAAHDLGGPLVRR
jgi:hypothetical protein